MKKILALLISCSLLSISFSSPAAVFKKSRKLMACERKQRKCEENGRSERTCKMLKEACKRDEIGKTCEEIYRKRYGYSYNSDEDFGELFVPLIFGVIMPPLFPFMLGLTIASLVSANHSRTAKLEKMDKKYEKLNSKFIRSNHGNSLNGINTGLFLRDGFRNGLKTGRFCENYPKLYGKAKMRRYIRDYLSETLGVETNNRLQVIGHSRTEMPEERPEVESAGPIVSEENSQ